MKAAALVIATLARRELVRFVRQRSRLVGALGQPLLFWLLLGAGLKASFVPAGEPVGTGAAQYLYPGILALTLLFTSIFATISVVEDRRAGFLQGVLASPAPRWSIVMGQAVGATALGVIQGGLLLLLAPAAGVALTPARVLASLGVMLPMAFAMAALGLVLAWRLESTQGFHALMNLALMPMWLLSGALFPAAGAPGWMALLMKVNPMAYGLAVLRRCLLGSVPNGGRAVRELAVMAACGAIALLAATLLARRASA